MPSETLNVSSMLPTKWEGKRKNQWIFMIEGVDSFLIKQAARPTMSIESVPISYMNSTRYVAGKPTWGQLNVVLYDPIQPSGAQQVMEWIRAHFESVSGRKGYTDFYKRDIQLKMLDPVGTVVELWDIKGAQIVEANFNEITYDDHNVAEVNLSIQIDNAVLQF